MLARARWRQRATTTGRVGALAPWAPLDRRCERNSPARSRFHQSPLDARVDDLPAKAYWNPDTGEVVVGVKHIVFVPIFAFRFDSYIDRVAIDVR